MSLSAHRNLWRSVELNPRRRPVRVVARQYAPPRAAGRFTFPSREAPAASPKAQVVLLGRKRFDLHSLVGDFLRDRLASNKHNDRIDLHAPKVSVNGVSKTLVRASRFLSPGASRMIRSILSGWLREQSSSASSRFCSHLTGTSRRPKTLSRHTCLAKLEKRRVSARSERARSVQY